MKKGKIERIESKSQRDNKRRKGKRENSKQRSRKTEQGNNV